MINGIKPITKPKPKITIKTEFDKPKTNGLSFDEAMDNLLVKIQENYDEWYSKTDYESKKMNLSLKEGRKFIKVVHDNSVWGFINLTNPKFKERQKEKSQTNFFFMMFVTIFFTFFIMMFVMVFFIKVMKIMNF